MNYAAFTDGKIDLNTLQELAFTYPFFSEKRLLLLDGTGILKTGKDEFVSIMENMPDLRGIHHTGDLFLYESVQALPL